MSFFTSNSISLNTRVQRVISIPFNQINKVGNRDYKLICRLVISSLNRFQFTFSPSSINFRGIRSSTIMAASSQNSYSSVDLQSCYEVAIASAREAGKIISTAWDRTKNIEHKGSVDLVTETDKQCEELIFNSIRTAFTDHEFIGEEGSAVQGFTAELTDAPTWMVDPVDGTTNFVHRFPFSCVSIGLAVNKQVVVGVVYNPILDEMFTAIKGQGAFRNGTKISCSDTSTLQHALFATELGTRRDDPFMDAVFDRMKAVSKLTRSVRSCGSCALNLCSVAMGRFDFYYEIGLGGPWDMAAASLILTEAGGKVVDPAGGPFNLMSRRILGTNGHLAESVSAILANAPLAKGEPQPIASVP